MVAILVNKIISLALIMAMGCLVVKLKILRAEDSKVISTLGLYLVMPCVILSAFQVDYSPEVKDGFLLALAAAAAIHMLLVVLTWVLKKLLKLDPVEHVSAMYSNAGNLIFPLVTAILGKDWLIFSSAFCIVQLVLMWSHAKSIICGDKGFQLKKILGNVNMISILIGALLFFSRLRLPALLMDTVDTLGGMIGPISMLCTGMLIGRMDLKKLLRYRRVWLIVALRLILLPLIILPLLKLTAVSVNIANADKVLLVTLLAVCGPAATTITQLSQVHGRDAQYASAINVFSTLLCILTIPLMVLLYQL